MAQFMIFMRESDNAWGKLSPAQQEELLHKYFAWIDGLKSKGQFAGGNQLEPGGRMLRVSQGRVVDGPFTETKEVLTGYFIIEAKDLAHAAEIAKTCPALTHGEGVELRPVGQTG